MRHSQTLGEAEELLNVDAAENRLCRVKAAHTNTAHSDAVSRAPIGLWHILEGAGHPVTRSCGVLGVNGGFFNAIVC